MSRNTDASDRTRRIRSLVEFQGKVAGRNTNAYSQSSEVATGVDYGAIVSNVNGCCDTNYAAYFTVEENARAVASVFDILAQSAFTIEWWQTEVLENGFLSRPIFSFGTFSEENVAFACLLIEGSIITRIGNTNYPVCPPPPDGCPTVPYGNFDSLLNPTHFAMVRDAGAEATIRFYRNGGFLGEFAYDGAIPITNSGSTLLTMRNQTSACKQSQMYGSLSSFRWTAASLYSGYTYYSDTEPFVPNFVVPNIPLASANPNNVITINTFPASGSVTSPAGFTITHYDATNLPDCI